ncbi:MAG TPA: hypothetical protein VGS06_00950 [Streptosporangiaceae bacterium]|nr:hypothetical protein [Streptosporangiaceae bacterium]
MKTLVLGGTGFVGRRLVRAGQSPLTRQPGTKETRWTLICSG